MLEAQRNEYATGLVELGNRAESVLQERNVEYSEELAIELDKDPKRMLDIKMRTFRE